MSIETPRGLLIHLIKYITDDSAIIAHVKRDFGVVYTLRDVQLARRENRPYVKPEPKPIADRSETIWNANARLSDARMVDRLRRVAR